MPVLYGKLEDFCEQGMEGNALPMFRDAGKMRLNKFGTVEGSYEVLVNLESGMHLTVYTEKNIYDWSWDRLEEKGLKHPRFFEGEIDLVKDYYEDRWFPARPESTWNIRIIHDAQFSPEKEHLWLLRPRVATVAGKHQTRHIPDSPCHNIRGVHYQEDNPLAKFYDDLEEYKQEILFDPAVSLFFDNPQKQRETIERHYDWDRDFELLPAHRTWTWFFRSGFCARLEY